jgi:penicillin amidase
MPDGPRYRELREVVADWTGRAAVDSADYRLVRAFRLLLAEAVLGSITAACREADERFAVDLILLREEGLWRLVTERPKHFLDPEFESWDQQLLAAVDQLIAYFSATDAALAEQTWGRRNLADIRHPLSRALPFAARWLDMPAEPLPGDTHMPRFQAPAEGASMRLVVSPGREQKGIFHMPTGQSGHPLSPHYRDGHAAWVKGEPTPFLPGPPEHALVLNPAS